MDAPLQGSLLDLTDTPAPGRLDEIQRTPLSDGAWIEVLSGWMRGADELFERLLHTVLGTPRPLLLRPVGGGSALRYEVGHGDLLVMGGSCQRTWQHAIPKSAKPLGPRISVQFRTRDVR